MRKFLLVQYRHGMQMPKGCSPGQITELDAVSVLDIASNWDVKLCRVVNHTYYDYILTLDAPGKNFCP